MEIPEQKLVSRKTEETRAVVQRMSLADVLDEAANRRRKTVVADRVSRQIEDDLLSTVDAVALDQMKYRRPMKHLGDPALLSSEVLQFSRESIQPDSAGECPAEIVPTVQGVA